MTAGVYRIHCSVNDTYYVGESSNVHRRHAEHAKALAAGRHENGHLQAAWLKYGRAAFRFDVVWEAQHDVMLVLSPECVSELTKRMEVAVGCSMAQEGMRLFNIAPFEQWAKSNPSRNQAVRALQSVAAKRRWSDPAARAIHSAILRGDIPRKQETESDATRGLRSELSRARWRQPEYRARMSLAQSGENSAVARRVRCVETAEEFHSITEAARVKSLHKSLIVRAIRLGYRCGGYTWQYAQLDQPVSRLAQ